MGSATVLRRGVSGFVRRHAGASAGHSGGRPKAPKTPMPAAAAPAVPREVYGRVVHGKG